MRPYLSVVGHENEAARLEQAALSKEKHYNPQARESGGMCRGRPGPTEDVCWSSFRNPTERFLLRAEETRRLAADHRMAARTLRDAEMHACAGIAEDDRLDSPFDHRDDILRVEPLHGGVSRYLNQPWTEGVVVTFRPVLGMSAPWLQHVVDCQIARHAALGNDLTLQPRCLLVPKGVRATVAAVPDGFAVTVLAGERETAEELFRRADALTMPIHAGPDADASAEDAGASDSRDADSPASTGDLDGGPAPNSP
jgi:hypothetical protein